MVIFTLKFKNPIVIENIIGILWNKGFESSRMKLFVPNLTAKKGIICNLLLT